jgi:hypothetical protein
MRARFAGVALLLLLCAPGAPAAPPDSDSAVQFKDITRAAGLRFIHNNGAFGKKYLPETMGPGVAFIDFDGDGRQDIFLVNGKDWPAAAGRPGHRKTRSTPKLYRNNGDGTFTDVTTRAGLAIEIYGMGAAVGDFNNDGYDDLFVTVMGPNHLFRNNGNGTFTDVTRRAGLEEPAEFSTSAAWLDYDKDGALDLLVANYVEWSPEKDLFCTLDGANKSYCTPESYQGATARLFRNNGDGTFADVTQKAGLLDPNSKALGIAVLDADRDTWPDFFLANDTEPDKLYLNQQNGTFAEQGMRSGVAFSEMGIARAGMGVDAADYDRSGYPSLLVANFSNEMLALYHNEGTGLFVDDAPRSAVGHSSLLTLGFGCFFFDYDNDGWLDIFVANGHIENEIERVQRQVRYAEPPHLFRNQGGGRFAEVTASAGSDLDKPRVARGAAYADIDSDGDPDILLTTSGGPAVLLRNDGGRNHSLRLRLVGTKSNRDGLGAEVTLTAGGDRQWQMLRSGSSYLSQSELVLTFGLGAKTQADSVEIRWPSGQVDRLQTIPAGQTVTVEEGKGIVARAKYAR